jgi:hypothetical protein
MARIDDAMRERARADLLEHLHHGARLAASLLEPEVARVLDAIRVRVARGERAILTSTADDAEKRVRQWATATLVDARKPRVEVGGRYDPTGTRGERTVPGDATARVTLSEAIERMLAFPWDLGERVCAERAFDLLYRAGFPDLKLKDDARWEVLKQQLEDKVLRGKWREQPLGRSTPGYVCAALRGLGLPTKQANSRVAAVERKIAERKHVPLTDEEAAMLTRCAEKEARRGRNVVEPDHIKQLPDVDVTEEERGE